MKNQRLTEKRGNFYYDTDECVISDCSNKLGKLEDIEEELGIDFITLYKALTNGVWVKNKVGQIYHTNIYLHNLKLSYFSTKNDFCFMTPDNTLLLFNRIKQDWSLTREEL